MALQKTDLSRESTELTTKIMTNEFGWTYDENSVGDTYGNLHERAFLAGMLSRMDALCKVNIETILAEFDLGEEMSNALRENTGVLGDLLKITKAVEIDQLEVTMGLCQLHHIDDEQLQEALLESWEWVESVKSDAVVRR